MRLTGDRRALAFLMIAASFSTGMVDAATYLALHRVFIANMTGNLIFVGLGSAGHAGFPIARCAAALVGFMIGSSIAGQYLRAADLVVGRSARTWHLFCLIGLVLGGLGVAADALHPSEAITAALIAAFAGAMGAQAVTARRIGVADVSTVVVTSTLASFSGDKWFGPNRSTHSARRGGAVAAMLLGAIVGALMVKISLVVPMLVAASLLLAIAAVLRAAAEPKAEVVAEK